jgi:hypothetical protein
MQDVAMGKVPSVSNGCVEIVGAKCEEELAHLGIHSLKGLPEALAKHGWLKMDGYSNHRCSDTVFARDGVGRVAILFHFADCDICIYPADKYKPPNWLLCMRKEGMWA